MASISEFRGSSCEYESQERKVIKKISLIQDELKRELSEIEREISDLKKSDTENEQKITSLQSLDKVCLFCKYEKDCAYKNRSAYISRMVKLSDEIEEKKKKIQEYNITLKVLSATEECSNEIVTQHESDKESEGESECSEGFMLTEKQKYFLDYIESCFGIANYHREQINFAYEEIRTIINQHEPQYSNDLAFKLMFEIKELEGEIKTKEELLSLELKCEENQKNIMKYIEALGDQIAAKKREYQDMESSYHKLLDVQRELELKAEYSGQIIAQLRYDISQIFQQVGDLI